MEETDRVKGTDKEEKESRREVPGQGEPSVFHPASLNEAPPDEASLEEDELLEEEKMTESKKKEQRFLDVFRDEPLESLTQATPTSPEIMRGILRGDNLDSILHAQELTAQTQSPSKNTRRSKRSKRYYVRKRIEEGKPYIPARIRAMGKKRAKELGYDVWEKRSVEREEELREEKRILDSRDRIQKLSSVFRMLSGKILGYMRERRTNQ